MAVNIAIRNNKTGEVRVHRDPDATWWSHSEFAWTEGNFGCDCNRHLVFLWAAGEDEADEAESVPCGHELYTVLWVEPRGDGKRYWLENLENFTDLPALPGPENWPEFNREKQFAVEPRNSA